MIALSGMTLTTSACVPDAGPGKTESPDSQPKGNRCLVVYFSCTGTTEGIARQIADITGGDTWQVRPKQPYTAADLDYNSDCRANREQNDPSARPAIDGRIENLSDYDVVFLGYPIWWGKAPKIIFTFLESYDLSGKTIIPFCTSGSSGIGSSDTDLRTLAAQANWKPGRRFRTNETKGVITSWIEGLKLDARRTAKAR